MTRVIQETLRFCSSLFTGIIFSLLMTTTPEINAKTSKELESYRAEFIRIGKLFDPTILNKDFLERAKNVDLSIGDIGRENVIGICYGWINSITIQESIWEVLSEEQREELVFHELGHCVLKRHEHTLGGIMRAGGIINPHIYRYYYKHLINQLFFCERGDCVDIEYKRGKYDR